MNFTHIWNFIHIPPVNQKLLTISHLFSQFSHFFSHLFQIKIHESPQLITPYLHMEFQTHTAIQSEVIGNFTPFYTIFTPFWGATMSKKRCEIYFCSPNNLTYWLLPTYEISYSYRQSIRSYWQFHTFFLIFTPFLGVAKSKKGVKYYFFVGS